MALGGTVTGQWQDKSFDTVMKYIFRHLHLRTDLINSLSDISVFLLAFALYTSDKQAHCLCGKNKIIFGLLVT